MWNNHSAVSKQYDDKKKNIRQKAKTDLLGVFFESDLYGTLFKMAEDEGQEERGSWETLENEINRVAGGAVDPESAIESRATEYGLVMEEKGFRIGFHVAMRLCMEGVNGGVAL